jgi:MFS family permease
VVARFASATATMLLRAVFLWQVFAISRSTFYLGLIGLVQFLPAPVAGLLGGAFADSHDRRRIVLAAQAIAVVASLALAGLSRLEVVTLPLLLGLVVLVSVTAAFEAPARQATLPSLVPSGSLASAVTVFVTAQSLAFMLGPALAGVVIGHASVTAAYLVAAGLSLVSFAFVTRLELRPRDPDAPRRAVSLAAIRQGIDFVRGQKVVLGCMTLDMFAVLFGGATALLPVYADSILNVGPRGYGLLASSLEIGGLVTSLVLLARRPIARLGSALFVAVAVFGIGTVVFGLSRSFPLSVAAYCVVGMADQISVVVRSTIVQTMTPDELRGRVSSVNMIFIGASNQLGAAESGFVAALSKSPTFSVVSGGVLCLVVVVLTAILIPELARYGRAAPR